MGTAKVSDPDDAHTWCELRSDSQWREFTRSICDEGFSVHKTGLRDVVNPWPEDNDRRAIRCPDGHRGVYAFRDPLGDGEFLYVGKSDDGIENRDVKVRIGQHLTPKDMGGDLRKNWCARMCQTKACCGKDQCGGSDPTYVGAEFRRFERRMIECEVWTITKQAVHIGSMTDLENRLIELTDPTYQSS